MTYNSRSSIGTTPSGQFHRDTIRSPIYRDFAKTHANPDTDGNSPYHRAVMFKQWRPETKQTTKQIRHDDKVGSIWTTF
jgi:hypothetical protein